MTLDELIAKVRIESDDLQQPYLSSDAVITEWLDEAEEEAAIRSSLIHESANPLICQIAVTAGRASYPVHSSVLEITYAAFTATGSSTVNVLALTDRADLDRTTPGWRTKSDIPRQLVQNDTTLQLGCLPSMDGLLTLECFRTPLASIGDTDRPEIGRAHHRHLVQWALHKCYSRPDAEVFDPKRSDRALMEFTRVFGIRPDAELRRNFYKSTPAHNQAYW